MESNMDSNTPKRQRTALAPLPNGLQPMLVRIDQAATIIGTSRRSIYHLIATNQLQAVKAGRSTLIVYESLQRYAEKLPVAKIRPYIPKRQHAETAVV